MRACFHLFAGRHQTVKYYGLLNCKKKTLSGVVLDSVDSMERQTPPKVAGKGVSLTLMNNFRDVECNFCKFLRG